MTANPMGNQNPLSPLIVSYDADADVLTIDNGEGPVRYAGDLFRTLAFPQPGHVYRVDLDCQKRAVTLTSLTLIALLTSAEEHLN